MGRSIYNCVPGRFGGWKTQNNRVESVNKGIIEISQAADELASQVLTNIKNKYWPNLKFLVNPEARGYVPGQPPPAPPKVNPGEHITMFTGEELEPIFKPEADPTVPWMMDQLKEGLSKLGGSSVLFGERQPGVDSGYQNAQAITQAEHIDAIVEQKLKQGAVQRFTIIMLYIRKLNESVTVHYSEDDTTTTVKRKIGKYLSIDPKDLYPLPRIDARVRKPRPIDFIAAIRTFREASDDRQGKGPALADQVLLSEVLARESPDIDKKLIRIQQMENELIKSGVLTTKIGNVIGLKLAKAGVPEPTPQGVAGVDPALAQAIQQTAQGQAAGAGGIHPDLLRQIQEKMNNLNMKSGGMLSGDAQPEARVGEMIAGSLQ